MNNQQNGHVILWPTWQKYETIYRLLTCTIEAKSILVMIFESFDVPLLSLVSAGFS